MKIHGFGIDESVRALFLARRTSGLGMLEAQFQRVCKHKDAFVSPPHNLDQTSLAELVRFWETFWIFC